MDFFYNIFSPIQYYTDIYSPFAHYYAPSNFNYNFCNSIFNYTNPFANWFGINNYYNNNYLNNYYYNYDQYNGYTYSGIYDYCNSYKPTSYNNYNYAIYKPSTIQTTNPSTNPLKPTTHNNKYQKVSPEIGKTLADNALKYEGYSEENGKYRKFTTSPEWCADFIYSIVKETYNGKNLDVPQGFKKLPGSPHYRVEEIKQWGIKNDVYYSIADKDNKADAIKNNIKKGDILILRENGASHTGFVTQVFDDGSFETVEGNRNDQVMTHVYEADHPDISGFVQLA